MKWKEALALLKEMGVPENVIDHCIAVSENAVVVARKAQKDFCIDLHTVEIGGLLHDCGRSKSHGVDHGIVGAHLLEKRGINGELQKICERHVCAGIPREVAEVIGLPPRDLVPVTMEEKIVCQVDNLTNHTLEELQIGWKTFFGSKNGDIIVTHLNNLHKELEPYL